MHVHMRMLGLGWISVCAPQLTPTFVYSQVSDTLSYCAVIETSILLPILRFGMNETVKTLQYDLARKFERHGSRLKQMWRSLDQEERENVLRDASADRSVLKDLHDTSLGRVCRLIPEWDLRDLTPPSSDVLLDILKHRATTPFVEQYINGVDGAPGDHKHMLHSVQTNGFGLPDTSTCKDHPSVEPACMDHFGK